MRVLEKSRFIVGGAVALLLAACSLIVDKEANQCASNADCTSGAACVDGVCVGGAANAEAGADALVEGAVEGGGDADCIPKVPVSQEDFLNEKCTTATCIDFDNCARLGICDGGALPALVDPPEGGF